MNMLALRVFTALAAVWLLFQCGDSNPAKNSYGKYTEPVGTEYDEDYFPLIPGSQSQFSGQQTMHTATNINSQVILVPIDSTFYDTAFDSTTTAVTVLPEQSMMHLGSAISVYPLFRERHFTSRMESDSGLDFYQQTSDAVYLRAMLLSAIDTMPFEERIVVKRPMRVGDIWSAEETLDSSFFRAIVSSAPALTLHYQSTSEVIGHEQIETNGVSRKAIKIEESFTASGENSQRVAFSDKADFFDAVLGDTSISAYLKLFGAADSVDVSNKLEGSGVVNHHLAADTGYVKLNNESIFDLETKISFGQMGSVTFSTSIELFSNEELINFVSGL